MNVGSKINMGAKPNKKVSATTLNTYFMFIFVKKVGRGGGTKHFPPSTTYSVWWINQPFRCFTWCIKYTTVNKILKNTKTPCLYVNKIYFHRYNKNYDNCLIYNSINIKYSKFLVWQNMVIYVMKNGYKKHSLLKTFTNLYTWYNL